MAAPKKRPTNPTSGRMKLYKSYMFRDKDPAIDEFRTVMQDAYGPKITNKNMVEIEDMGGPTSQTIRNWFFGETKRPQNCSIEAAGRALGMKRVWVKDDGKVVTLSSRNKRR
jgi:hypothetical protein